MREPRGTGVYFLGLNSSTSERQARGVYQVPSSASASGRLPAASTPSGEDADGKEPWGEAGEGPPAPWLDVCHALGSDAHADALLDPLPVHEMVPRQHREVPSRQAQVR
jgi:hypothetical protein